MIIHNLWLCFTSIIGCFDPIRAFGYWINWQILIAHLYMHLIIDTAI